MDIEDFLPNRPGYAEYGYQRPVWEKQLYNKQPHTKSNVKTYTTLSNTTTQYAAHAFSGGQNWEKVNFCERAQADGAITNNHSSIPLNRLFGSAQATTTHEELVGLGYNRNPEGMQEWALTKSAVRVKKAKLYLQCEGHGTASSIDFMFIPERSDATFVSSIVATTTDKNTPVTSNARIPGAIVWTHGNNNTYNTQGNLDPQTFKKLEFDIPQYFHDKEWFLDAPNAATPNFWVAKDSNLLFTGTPNLVLNGHLYCRLNSPDNTNTAGVFLKVLMSWDIELHTGNNIDPNPNQVDAA